MTDVRRIVAAGGRFAFSLARGYTHTHCLLGPSTDGRIHTHTHTHRTHITMHKHTQKRNLRIVVVDIVHGKSDGTNDKMLLWDLTSSGEESNRHREELGVPTNPSARHSTAFFEEYLLERDARPEEVVSIIHIPSDLPDVTKRNSQSKTADTKAPPPT